MTDAELIEILFTRAPAAPSPPQGGMFDDLIPKIEVELFDGHILEFPSGTARDVIERVAREQAALRRSATPASPPLPSQSSMPPRPGRPVLTADQSGVLNVSRDVADAHNQVRLRPQERSGRGWYCASPFDAVF